MAINFGDILGGLGAAYGGRAQEYAQGIRQREQGLTEQRRVELEARQRAMYQDADTALQFLTESPDDPLITNQMRADNIIRLAEDGLDALSNYSDADPSVYLQVLDLAQQVRDGTDPTAARNLSMILAPAASIYRQRFAPQQEQERGVVVGGNLVGQNTGRLMYQGEEQQPAAQSNLGQLARDRELGYITQEQFDALSKQEITPQQDAQDIYGESEAMRKEFNSLQPVKDFASQSSAYGRLAASAADASPAGDLALVFNYMKVLDPGSTVREGEAASIRNAGNVPQRVIAQYNSLFSGEGSLSAEQRADVLDRASRLYNAAENSFNDVYRLYSGIAQRRNLPIEDVLIDYRYTPAAATVRVPAPTKWLDAGLTQEAFDALPEQEKQTLLEAQ